MSDDQPQDSVLRSGVNAFEAEMIRNLLKDVGIPCLFNGPDFDVAELGKMAHANARGIDVVVPTAALEAAQARLAEALGVMVDDLV